MHQSTATLKHIYSQYYIDSPKDFIELLKLIGEKSLCEVEKAIKLLLTITPCDITTEKIKYICERKNSDLVEFKNNNSTSKITINSVEILRSYTSLLTTSKEMVLNEIEG